jgi:hypothetical protein
MQEWPVGDLLDPQKGQRLCEDFARFAGYAKLSDQMIEQASKEEVAAVARVLALHLAHYRAKHGEIPLKNRLNYCLAKP